MTNRTISPDIKDATDFSIRLPELERFTLDNGIPVYLMRAANQETIQLDVVFNAGSWYENEDLLAAATNYLLKNGSRRHSALEINETIEYYGAFVNRHCSTEFADLTLHCMASHAPKLLPVIREIITEASFPEEELSLYQQNMKQRLLVNLQKCDFVANRHIDTYLFGTYHPYGRTSSLLAYDALQRESLQGFHQKHYLFSQCRIFIAGNVSDEFLRQLNEQLGDRWSDGEPAQKKDFALQPSAEKKFRIDNDPNGVQGAIRIARLFPNRYHPDFPRMAVLNTIFGGYFGSRLMSNIREEKGYTYGIYSSLYNQRQSGAINIATEAGKEVCEATIQEIYKEMKKLCAQPVPEEELSLVRNYIIGSLLGDLDGPFQVIQRWKNLILGDLDEHYFYNNVQTIKSISAEELQQLAQQYYQPEDFYELVVV